MLGSSRWLDIRKYEDGYLIEVHLNEPSLRHCTYCDGPNEVVSKIYWRINFNVQNLWPYYEMLDCCVDKKEIKEWVDEDDLWSKTPLDYCEVK